MSEEVISYEKETALVPITNIYAGASLLDVSAEQAKILMAPVSEKEVRIRPDGIIYLPQTFYRKRLNDAFGPGHWALIPKGPFMMKGNIVIREYALIVCGHFVAEAIGENEYHENNPRMSYASAAEGARSDCITRCCKDLGVAWELWDPTFIEAWKVKYAVKVWRTKVQKWHKGGGKTVGGWEWRRKEDKPFEDEGEVPVGGEPAYSEGREGNGEDEGKATEGQLKFVDKLMQSSVWTSEELDGFVSKIGEGLSVKGVSEMINWMTREASKRKREAKGGK